MTVDGECIAAYVAHAAGSGGCLPRSVCARSPCVILCLRRIAMQHHAARRRRDVETATDRVIVYFRTRPPNKSAAAALFVVSFA